MDRDVSPQVVHLRAPAGTETSKNGDVEEFQRCSSLPSLGKLISSESSRNFTRKGVLFLGKFLKQATIG